MILEVFKGLQVIAHVCSRGVQMQGMPCQALYAIVWGQGQSVCGGPHGRLHVLLGTQWYSRDCGAGLGHVDEAIQVDGRGHHSSIRRHCLNCLRQVINLPQTDMLARPVHTW